MTDQQPTSDELLQGETSQDSSSVDPREKFKELQGTPPGGDRSNMDPDPPPVSRDRQMNQGNQQNEMGGSTIPSDIREQFRQQGPSEEKTSQDAEDDEVEPESNVQFQSDKLDQVNPEREIQQAQQKIEELEDAPEKKYRKRLEDAGVSIEEAELIIDRIILEQKSWEEEYSVYKDLTVTFRTRNQLDMEKVYQQIEAQRPDYPQTQSTLLAKWNLATSLSAYGSRQFSETDQGIQKAAAFIESLDQNIFRLLNDKLQDFTEKIDVVFSEGYADVF